MRAVACRLLPPGNFLLLITTLRSLIPHPLPPSWWRQSFTADSFQRCFFHCRSQDFSLSHCTSSGNGRRKQVLGLVWDFFSAINNFWTLKRQESEAGVRLHWNTPFVLGVFLPLVFNFKANHYYFLLSYFPEEIPLLLWLVWRFPRTSEFFSLAFLSFLISFRQG